MKYLTLLFGLFTTLVSSAQEQKSEPEKYYPQQLTANDLLLTCASSSLTHLGRRRQQFCSGFISGVEETLRLHNQRNPPLRNTTICFPEGMTALRYADVYKRYAGRQSTNLKRSAVVVVIEAFEDAFACKP